MSTIRYVSPACRVESGSVRVRRMQKSARCANDDHTFWPFTTKCPSSRVELVRTPARSEPAPGSEKPWHQISSRGEERREVARLLLLGAVRDDRRPGHADADDADVRRRLGSRHLLEEDRLVRVRRAAAAVLLGPREPDVAGVVERAAPLAHLGPVEASRSAAVALEVVREVLLEPGAQP